MTSLKIQIIAMLSVLVTLLPVAKAQELKLVRTFSQSHEVSSLVFLTDNSTLVSGGSDQRGGGEILRFWDLQMGKLKRAATLPSADATAIAFSNDGHYMARGSWDDVDLFDARTGKLKMRLKPRGEIILGTASFSPKGDLVASGGASEVPNSAQVVIWDTKTGRTVRILKALGPVVFSADGKSIVTNAENMKHLIIWDVATGKRKRVLGDHGDFIEAIELLDNDIVVASSKNHLKFWDMTTGKLQRTLRLKKRMERIAFSKNGTWLLCQRSEYLPKSDEWLNEINLWDVATGNSIHTIKASGPVAFAPNGQYAATADGRNISLWKINKTN